MKKQYIGRLIPYLLLVTCCLSLALGCGYTIQGKATLPFKSISIGKIINRTFEPKLEDAMQLALASELTKNGFVIAANSDYSIEGTINVFELRTLSAKAGMAAEYEVIIRGDFRLVDPSGKTRALRNKGVFIVSFQGTESLQTIMALKEKATERALRDISSEMIASIIYQ